MTKSVYTSAPRLRFRPREFDPSFPAALKVLSICAALWSCEQPSEPSGAEVKPKVAQGTVNKPTVDSVDGANRITSLSDTVLHAHLSTLTPGATIHYTIDGKAPTNKSPLYGDSGVRIDSSCTLRAIAVRQGWTSSETMNKSFVFGVRPLSLHLDPGYFWPYQPDQPVYVKLSTATPDVQIHYTLDGSTPSKASRLYKDSLLIDSGNTLKAFATKPGWIGTETLIWSFAVQIGVPPVGVDGNTVGPYPTGTSTPTPVADSPPSPTSDSVAASVAAPAFDWVSADPWKAQAYDQPLHVYLSSATPDAEIHYTLDGSYPTVSSPKPGDGGIYIDSTRILNAIATREGLTPSAMFQKIFRLEPQPARSFFSNSSPWKSLTYDAPIRVSLSSWSSNSVIHYTVDGSIPDGKSPEFPSSGLLLDTNTFLRTIVTNGKSVSIDSNYQLLAFFQTQPVEIIPPGGSYSWPIEEKNRWAPFKIAMWSRTPGVAIHYTTDGSTPTRNSPIYSDSLVFDKYTDSIVYQAIAIDTLHPKIATSEISSILIQNSLSWNGAIGYGTLHDDRDGHTYRTIRIGTQNWMAENLDFEVPNSVCYDNAPSNCARFGRLYTWAAAMGNSSTQDTATSTGHQGVCPAGWHVPRDQEWQELLDSSWDADQTAARLLSRTLWESGSVRGDAIGFRVLPTGSYAFSYFGGLKTEANFWTATGGEEGYATYRSFNETSFYSGSELAGSKYSQKSHSLRCVGN